MLHWAVVKALLLVAIACGTASADGDLCARGVKHHGAPIDLDLRNADVHEVFRLLADTGHVNLVVSDEVAGKVTMRLKQVAWDQAACTVAAVKQLTITVDGNILLVRVADKK